MDLMNCALCYWSPIEFSRIAARFWPGLLPRAARGIHVGGDWAAVCRRDSAIETPPLSRVTSGPQRVVRVSDRREHLALIRQSRVR
jgi:hypothetical protein